MREEGIRPGARRELRLEAVAPLLEKNAAATDPKSQRGRAIHYTDKSMACLRRLRSQPLTASAILVVKICQQLELIDQLFGQTLALTGPGDHIRHYHHQ